MPAATAPQTLAIGNAIVSYLSSLIYPSTSLVYTLAQLESIKDVVDLVASGGACCEVYGDKDSSERRGFGGRIWDTQSWFILSLCAMDTPAHAQQIYNVRDALVQPFQTHATLGTIVSNLFHAQLIDKSGRFFRVQRSGQWLRAHVIELETRQEWYIPTPPGVTS
jgi:hypothetical protein